LAETVEMLLVETAALALRQALLVLRCNEQAVVVFMETAPVERHQAVAEQAAAEQLLALQTLEAVETVRAPVDLASL
jgi:hypothetical protein